MDRKDFLSHSLGVARSFRFRLLTNLTNGLAILPPDAISGRRRGRGAAGRKAALGAAAGALSLTALFSHAGQAQTLPQGGSVVAGSASINQPSPTALNVVQTSNTAIINWQSFSIGAGNSVNFQQPSSSSVTLNRVLGNDPSAIFGTLTANGTVMLVNPNGVFFGPGSRVDVGGLVASTANIKDADFLAGKYLFGTPSANPDARIVNQGDISIKDAGLAALVAPQVQNNGVIRARLGRVALGAAQSFTLDFHGDGLLSFGAGSEVAAVSANADGSMPAALVVNSGQISAEGGVVELSARAVKGVIDNVINTSGVVSAKSVGVQNGKIVLSGGSAGKVQVAGTLDASGTGAGETGGSIIATGESIAVAGGATMDTSGQAGGGLIAIGSDGSGAGARGTGAWAGSVSVAAGAQLKADALGQGDGGTVVVLAEDKTMFAGHISARGGAQGGDGGFAEVSAKQDIVLTGSADLTAAHGKTGTLLIDPATLKIVAAGGGTQNSNAGDGTVASGDADSGENTISVATLTGLNSTTNIVLEATGLITVDTSISLATGNGNSVTLRSTGAGGGITFTNSTDTISTQGGSISLEATAPGGSLSNIGGLTSNGGNITLAAGGNISLAGNINAGGGALVIASSAGSISRSGTLLLTGNSLRLSALGGHIGTSGSALAFNSGSLTLETGGNIYVTSDQTLSSLSVRANHALLASGNQYSVVANGLTFTVSDDNVSAGHTLTNITSSGTNISFISDVGITAGIVNAGAGTVSLTANGGNIVSAASGSPLITGSSLTLTALGSTGLNGAIGASGSALLTAVSSLTATSGSGIVNISNTGALALSNISSTTTTASTIAATGNITLGNVNFAPSSGSSSLTISSSAGSILDDGNSATKLTANALTLTAASAIGASGTTLAAANASSINLTATAGDVYFSTDATTTATFTSVSAGGLINLTSAAAATITSVATTANGNIAITSGGDLTYSKINAGTGNVTLQVGGGNLSVAISGSPEGITANKLTTSTTAATHTATLKTQVSEIASAVAGSTSGNVTVNQTGSVTLTNLVAAGGNVTVTVAGDGAVTTVKNISAGAVGGSGSISLTTSGAITASAGNTLAAKTLTINAAGAVATSGQHLKTQTAQLSLTNTGSYYVDNSQQLLTSLTINNKHNGSTANDLQLTSQELGFTVTDDGSKSTLSEINSTFLTTFSYTSDKSLVVGQLDLENVTTAKLTTSNGSIIDDANANTRISAKAVQFSATDNIGESGNAIGINTTKLAVTTAGNLLIDNANHFNELNITSTHKDTSANYTYAITGRHLDFAMTDSAGGYTFTRLIDSGFGAYGDNGAAGGLQYFTFSGDRDITLGQVNTGTFKYSYTPDNSQSSSSAENSVSFRTSKGAILDDGNDSTYVLASYIGLSATKNVGTSATNGDIDIVARGIAVTAGTASDLTPGTGGIYINALRTTGADNSANTLYLGSSTRTDSGGSGSGSFATNSGDVVVKLQVGDISTSTSVGTVSGSVTFEAVAGSILNPNSNTINATTKVTLKASEAIGSSTSAVQFKADQLDAIATNGLVSASYTGSSTTKFNEVTAGSTITLNSSSSNGVTLGKVIANAGASKLTITSSGNLNDDGNDATVIQASEIALSTGSGSIGATNQLKVNTTKLTAANSSSINIASSQALTDLTISRSSSASSISITGTNQTISISSSGGYALNTITSSSNLNFALNISSSTGVSVGAANVGTGKFTLSTAGSITYSGSGEIRAGDIVLTAGSSSSIGTSSSAVAVNGGKLTVESGLNIYVAGIVALTDLTIVSTNSSTSTLSNFGITGTGGRLFSITDSGTQHTIDVSGGSGSVTNFSFTGKKNIAISEIVATGAVALKTDGGGVNSNITMVGGGTIAGSSVTLYAIGSDTKDSIGNGSIGTSDRALKLGATSLTAVSNGNIYINNNSTALTTIDLTLTHKTAATSDNNTYAFTNIGTGRSLTIGDSTGVITVSGSSGSGVMDFTLKADRAILTAGIDAGTNTTGTITLQSTGGATGVAGTINRDSGTLTAGEVSLIAKASTGSHVGSSGQVTTATKKLSISSGGSIDVSNNTSLTDLSLDVSFKASGTPSGGTYSYAVAATGLTFTAEDVIPNTSVTAFKLTSVSQSGLNLTVTSSTTIQVTSVNVGAGTVKLTSGSSASINATNTSSVITAGRLEMTSSSIGNSTNGNSTFYGTVGTLSISATGSVNYNNQGNLAVDGLSNRSSSDSDNTLTLTVNSGTLTQASGSTAAISTNKLVLTVDNGAIGTSGTPLLINAETLTLSSGSNVYLSNQADLFTFGWTVKHNVGGTNSYGFTGKNLSATLSNSASAGNFVLDQFVDASGLDFTLSTATGLALGTVNVQSGRMLSLTTTGTTKNITTTDTSLAVTAGKLSLTATGSVGALGSAIKTSAQDLYVTTVGNVHLNNSAADLQTLSITSTQATGGSAPTFGITGENLTLTITDSGVAAVSVVDTTGLDFTFSTKRGQELGKIDLTKAGSATLTSSSAAITTTGTSTDRLTAAAVSITGTALGSSTNKLRIDTPYLTLSTSGDVYLTSNLHVEKLKLTNSTSSSTADRTFDITGKKLDGTDGMTAQATFTNAGGTVFSTISDTSGLDFDYSTSGMVTYGTINVGKANLLTITAPTAIRETDGTSSLLAGKVNLTASSGTVGQASGTGGGLLDITTSQIKIAANNGAYIDLKQKAKVAGFTVGGASEIKVSTGDLQIGGGDDADGGLSLNGATTTITVVNGSILGGGSIAGAGTLTLSASGAIGSANSALTTTANSSGTTTLTATASGGGIYLTEEYALTVSSMTAAGDVVLKNGNTNTNKNFTLAGALTATGHNVSITTSGSGAITSNTASVIDAASLTLSAVDSSIGATTSSNTRVKTTATKLTIYSIGGIVVGSSSDLTDLSIDRTPSGSNTSNSSGTVSITATNLTWDATDSSGTITFADVADTTGLNFTYKSRGNIAINKMDLGSGTASLTATQGVSTTAATITGTGTNKLTAGALTLAATTGTAAAIGSSGTALGLSVSSLAATAGTGGIYVSNDKALTTGALSSGGALSVKTTTGDLTLNGATSWGSGTALTLEAAGALRSNNIALTAGSNASSSITLKAGTGIGSADSAIRIAPYTSGSTGSTVSATVTGTGSLYLNVTSSLVGGLTTSVNNGATVVTGAGNMTIAGMTSTTDAVGNDISVALSSGNLTIGSTGAAGTISAGMQNGKVVLNAQSGSISQGHANSTINGGGVLLKSSGVIGASGSALGVNSRRLEAALTQSGSAIYLKTTSELSAALLSTNNGIISIAAGDAAAIDLNSVTSGGGNISVTTSTGGSRIGVGNVDAGAGTVTVNAGTGTVFDDGKSDTRITASTLSVYGGGGVGSSSAYLNTKTATITGGAGTGSVYIADSGTTGISLGTSGTALSVTDGSLVVTTAGATAVVNVTQTTDGSGKDVKITGSSGDITVTKLYAGAAASTGSPSSSLAEISAAGAILTSGSDTHIVAGKLSLTSTGGNIGAVTNSATGAGSPVLVKVGGIDKLSAATNASVISVTNSGTSAVTLGSTAVTLGTGSSAYIKTGGDLDVSAGLTVSNGSLLLESAGTLTLPAAGSITITGALTLKGTTDVVASGGGRDLTINASGLTFTSGSAGGNTKLTSTTGALNASLTGTGKNLTVSNTGALTGLTLAANGDIAFTNSVGFTATSVTATGTSRNVKLTATAGDLTVTTANAGATGTLELVAAAGSILGASDGSMTAAELKMTSQTAIGTSGQAFTTAISKVSATVTGTGDIYLAYTGNGASTGDLSTANGNINVSLNTGTLTVDGSKISAGNSGSLSLKSGGTVALTGGYINKGGDTTKSGLTVEASTITLAGNINTTGAQVYKGAATATGNLTAKSISFDKQVKLSDTTDQTFNTSAANGDVTLAGGFFGQAQALEIKAGTGKVAIQTASSNGGSLTISGGTIELAAITTDGAQSYTGATTLNGSSYSTTGAAFGVTGATTLASDLTVATTNGAVSFDGTLDGAHTLTVNSGSGDISFGGATGNTTRLGAITLNSSGATKLVNGIKAASLSTNSDGTLQLGGNIDTTGTQSYGELASLQSNTSFTGTTVTLSKGAQGTASGSQTIGVTGNLVLTEGFGTGANAVGGLSVSGTTTLGVTAVGTTGAQTYTGKVTLAHGTTTFTGSTVSLLDGVVNANGDSIAIVGNGAFKGDFGTTNTLAEVTVSGTTSFGGGTISTYTKQSYTGAASLTGNQILKDVSVATITFGSTIDSSNQSNLTLEIDGSSVVFNGAIGSTGKLGTLTINAGTTGKATFASTAHTKLAGDLVQTGGASIILPAVLDVDGAITLGIVTSEAGKAQVITGPSVTVPTGQVQISGGKDIVMGSLKGEGDIQLTINSSNGFIKIGSKDVAGEEAQPARKIVVASLTSSRATAINMYGTVAGRSDATAAYIVGPLRDPPYFINDMRWGPLEQTVVIPPSVVPPVAPVPSTPGAASLFTGNVNPGGITPNALAAFTAPTVLTVSNNLGGGINPGIVVPNQTGGVIGTPGAGSGGTSGGGTGATPVTPTQGSAPLGSSTPSQGQGSGQSPQGQGSQGQPQGQAQPQGQPQSEQERQGAQPGG